MKKITILLIFLLCSTWSIQAKPLDPDMTNATTSGSVRSNAKQVIFVFSADYTGTVAGASATWAAGGSINFTAAQPGDMLGPVAYTITSGMIHIIRLQ